MQTKRPALTAFFFVLGWGTLLGGYYLVHKPITPTQALALAAPLADVLVAVWLASLAGMVGQRLLRGWNIASAGERLVLYTALGWGVLGLVMLALGLARGLYAGVMWGLALALTAFLWRDLPRWWTLVILARREWVFPDRFSRLAGWFVLFTFALSGLTALAPPLKWDAHVYHLTLPKLYSQTHAIGLGGDFFFSGMPQLTEMLYTAAYLLRGEIAAQFLGWLLGAVLALGLAAHAAELFGPRLAGVAPAVLFASFTLALSLAWAYADLLLMLLALGVLVALRHWRLTREPRWLYLGAVFCGLAMGCKYTGVILPVAALAVLAWDYFTAARPQLSTSFFTLTFHFSLITLALFFPWLLKNLAFTGNPVFPLFFPTATVDHWRLFFYNRPDLTERNPVWATLIFFRALFLGVQGGNNYDATLTPLLVILPLGLALGWRKLTEQLRAELTPLTIFTLTSYGLWVGLLFISYYAVQARLFFSLFPALALLSVGGLVALPTFDTPTLRLSVIGRAVVGLVLGLSALQHGLDFAAHNPLGYLTGAQTAAAYRTDNLGWYPLALDKVNALPAGARVLFLWEPRSLGCVLPDRCDPDLIIDRWWQARHTLITAEAALAHWQSAGFTHILIYDLGVRFVREQQPDDPFSNADWVELDRLREQLQLVENIGGVYSLYQLP